MSVIVTGDDANLPVELHKDGVTFPIASTATVKAAVTTSDKKTIILAPVNVIEAAVGSDWTTSLVIVQFDSTSTGAITRLGKALLEIQVDDTDNTTGKTTWFADVSIVKGTIDQ